MAQIINTNMQSLNAQRNLAASQKNLGNTLERLSTGLRINSAKDDAAGLAISERFTAQIRGLNQAVRNANDGVSFSQTAESALSTVGNNLQRIRELAVQSASGSNSAGDRKSLDQEVQALIAEIRRISLNTEFNGEAILDGSKGDTFFQIGSNQGQMLAITGLDSRTTRLGNQEVFSPPAAADPPVAATTYRLTQDEVDAMNDENGITIGDITITGKDNTLLSAFSATGAPIVVSGPLNSLEEAVSAINKTIQDTIDVGDAKGQQLSEAGMKALLRTDNAGRTGIVITSNFNPDAENFSDPMFAVSGGAITDLAAPNDKILADQVFLADPGTDSSVLALDGFDSSFGGLDVLTRETATQAMGIVDGALNQINSLRAEMGAVQRRFESAIDNLRVSSDSMSAARSRIRDADFAAETAELTRYQILQQAGISVLSQANASPQSALSLLQ